MPRRPEDEEFLTPEQLEEVRRNLSLLPLSSVENFYRTAHRACTVERKPGAKAMQQLIQAWKVLRRWKWR
jgi:hypothetical protein